MYRTQFPNISVPLRLLDKRQHPHTLRCALTQREAQIGDRRDRQPALRDELVRVLCVPIDDGADVGLQGR